MDIIWSAKARLTYFKVMDYLQENWTRNEMIQFAKRTEIVIRAIKKNPDIFVHSGRHQDIHRAFIDKNNSLFYQVDNANQRIYLLSFFDNRQDPQQLNIS